MNTTGMAAQNLWERACPRRRYVRRHQCWMCNRHRGQSPLPQGLWST